ncbi:Hypothetical predicted protein [Olea europaea subsp. europaea]|uniref:Uncharacterized protein n=1 Tax=Olea europaea subsp. europaea TaxID=158383 RepID=A0A8S0VJ11_OLEEU|nr:Hypothetical predicted protein [Olea europaea subsp. europaea]
MKRTLLPSRRPHPSTMFSSRRRELYRDFHPESGFVDRRSRPLPLYEPGERLRHHTRKPEPPVASSSSSVVVSSNYARNRRSSASHEERYMDRIHVNSRADAAREHRQRTGNRYQGSDIAEIPQAPRTSKGPYVRQKC